MHPNFLVVVKHVWEETQVYGCVGYKIFKKLQSLKIELKKWNMEVFGNIGSKVKSAEEELHSWDLAAKSKLLQESEIKRRRELKGEVWKLRKIKENL